LWPGTSCPNYCRPRRPGNGSECSILSSSRPHGLAPKWQWLLECSRFFYLNLKTLRLTTQKLLGTCAPARCPNWGGRAQPHIPASAAPVSWRTRATPRRSASQDFCGPPMFPERVGKSSRKNCGGARCRTILKKFQKQIRRKPWVLLEVVLSEAIRSSAAANAAFAVARS